MIHEGYYSIRIVNSGIDGQPCPAHVELHQPEVDNYDSPDFLGIDPSKTDIATIAAAHRLVRSEVHSLQISFDLLDNTREFHDGLAKLALLWLEDELGKSQRDSQYEMNSDEYEIAELLGLSVCDNTTGTEAME